MLGYRRRRSGISGQGDLGAPANEVNMPEAIKLVDAEKGLIEGLAIPFGGPFDGKDFDGEFFSKDTDLLLDDYPTRPLRFQHGKDKAIEYAKVGTQVSQKMTDAGWWISAQLDKADKYGKMVMELLRSAKDTGTQLYFSTGGDPRAQEGGSPRQARSPVWPWMETSITFLTQPTPTR